MINPFAVGGRRTLSSRRQDSVDGPLDLTPLAWAPGSVESQRIKTGMSRPSSCLPAGYGASPPVAECPVGLQLKALKYHLAATALSNTVATKRSTSCARTVTRTGP